MFVKRVAAKVKKAKAELEEIHRQQQAMVETLIANYHTLLRQIDADGPLHAGQAKAALAEEVTAAPPAAGGDCSRRASMWSRLLRAYRNSRSGMPTPGGTPRWLSISEVIRSFTR